MDEIQNLKKLGRLVLDQDKCIGCRACSSMFPKETIVLKDEGTCRTIIFPAFCDDGCLDCAQICPVGAITWWVQSRLSMAERPEVSDEQFCLNFDLELCQRCGEPFATEGEIWFTKAIIPADLQIDASGQSWIELCPSCRRSIERERSSRDLVKARGGS
ncbi:MAG: hypothetical protein ACXQT4_04505, partial [Methanotrichaceae archaeon]